MKRLRQLPLDGRVHEQCVRVYSSWRLGPCGTVEHGAVPSCQASVSLHLSEVRVARFRQPFDSGGQPLAHYQETSQ